MKIYLLIVIVFITHFSYSQRDYKVEINGKEFEIALDKDYELNVNNAIFKIKVKQKDTLFYEDDAVSFKYPKDYKVVKTVVEYGIEQLMLMTAEGSGFIIQKYATLNPTMLNELMINEVTKESINYGYEMTREDYQRVLSSGLKINVNKAVLNYNDETNIYEIASFGKKDSGLIIMTMEMTDLNESQGKQLINTIWNTLEIK